eukprot:scaffold3878_cov363-Prasinococcus_capsulatus_cf.AAC.6
MPSRGLSAQGTPNQAIPSRAPLRRRPSCVHAHLLGDGADEDVPAPAIGDDGGLLLLGQSLPLIAHENVRLEPLAHRLDERQQVYVLCALALTACWPRPQRSLLVVRSDSCGCNKQRAS